MEQIKKEDLLNKVINADSLEHLQQLPEKSFDFIFVDPPYFMQLNENKKLSRVEGDTFHGVNDSWDKFSSMEEYKNFTKEWISKSKRVLKNTGLLCVISSMQSIYEIGNILREEGFWVINEIIWLKSNPTPNFKGIRLTNSHETLIVASPKKNAKYTFNYKTAKTFNGGKQLGSVWKIPVCSGNERLKDEQGFKLHNTQKPEELLYRLITVFTKKGDLILDPFAGTLTTAVIAKRTGRNYYMIEKDSAYIRDSMERLNKTEPIITRIEDGSLDEKIKYPTFKELIQKGRFFIGERFYLKDRTKSIILTDENGKFKINEKDYSIHEACSILLNKPNKVNAFDYLYVLRNNEFVSIDEIRK